LCAAESQNKTSFGAAIPGMPDIGTNGSHAD
jgi:hypothetical protein